MEDFSNVVVRYNPLIDKITSRWKKSLEPIPHIDITDLGQEIREEFYNKHGEYDRTRGNWGTFISKISTNRIINIYKRETRYLKGITGKTELDSIVEDDITVADTIRSNDLTPLQIVLYKEFYETLYFAVGTIEYTPRKYRYNNHFAQQLFLEIICPSEDLIDFIKRRNKRNKIQKVLTTEEALAIYFNVSIPNIKRGIDLMKKVIRRAAKKYGYYIS